MAPSAQHSGEIRRYADREQLAAGAAALFVRIAAESIEARGRFRAALSGGSTPRRGFEVLATFAPGVDWERVDIFWSDERYVSAEDRDSNYRMAADVLLRKVPIPSTNIHRVPTEIAPPQAAAEAYERSIRQVFGDAASAPRFDLVFLGLGADGHTASLFPHSKALQETSRLVVADFRLGVNAWRISMTASLISRARTVAFLVAGGEKAAVLRDVVFGPRDPERLPAQLIAPEGDLLWLADEAAAALLPV